MSQIESKLKVVARTGGIKLESQGDNWINPSEQSKDSVLLNLDEIKTWIGKVVIVNMSDDKTYAGMGLSENQPEEMAKEKGEILLDSSHIVKISGREFITFAGLLDVAHKKGLHSVETELIESKWGLSAKASDDVGVFVFKAIVQMSTGQLFSAYGDATSNNVGAMIKPHILRMAETRAVARALRLATNIGMTSLEELAEREDKHGTETPEVNK